MNVEDSVNDAATELVQFLLPFGLLFGGVLIIWGAIYVASLIIDRVGDRGGRS